MDDDLEEMDLANDLIGEAIAHLDTFLEEVPDAQKDRAVRMIREWVVAQFTD